MHPTGSKRENEIKLRVAGPDAAAALLQAAGFRIRTARTFEENTVYDTPDLAFRTRRSLVRIRRFGPTTTLTFKAPPDPGPHKSREELETEISDGAAMQDILSRLGLGPVFRYEKYRSEWTQADGAGIATVDETPIGCFIELEGPPEWVDRTAAALGFHAADYITASYGALYFQWCHQQSREPGDMVFR